MTSQELNKRIENRALYSLEKYFGINIDNHLKDYSTEASWDGYITYKNDLNTKAGHTQIPCQVKGSIIEEKYHENKATIEIADLINYKLNGVLYFVVKMKFDEEYNVAEERILYKLFFNTDVDKILEKARVTNQETVTVDLEQIHNSSEMDRVCKLYFAKRTIINESTIIPNDFEIKPEYKIHILNDTKYNHPIFGHDYFCQIDTGLSKYYIENLNLESLTKYIDEKITINEKLYFEKVKVIEQNDSRSLVLNEALSFEFSESKVKVLLNEQTDIICYKNAVKFLYDTIIYGHFNIGEEKVALGKETDMDKNDNIFKNILEKCEILLSFIQSLGVNRNFKFSDFSKENINGLMHLYKDANVEEYVKPLFIELAKEGYVFVACKKNKQLKIYNIFDDEFLSKYALGIKNDEGEIIRALPYFDIEPKYLKKISLPTQNEYEKQFNKYVDLKGENFHFINYFCLNLLISYDENKNMNFLKIAEFTMKKLYEAYKSDTFLINCLQIKRRLNIEFTHEEYVQLESLVSSTDNNIKFCAYVLKRDKFNASIVQIDDAIKEMPIYNLYLSLTL